MKNDIRSSGIGVVGNIPFEYIYVNSTIKEDFLDVLISYFKNKAGNYD